MSLESIHQQGAEKRRRRAARIRRRHIGVTAVDSNFTGQEPVWDGWEKWDVMKFMKERHRALNFYNYYAKTHEVKPSVVEWMQVHGYSKEDVRAVKRAPDYLPGITTGSLCTCMNRGMPALHPDAQKYHDKMPGVGGTARSDEEFVREAIAGAIKAGRQIAEAPEDPSQPAKEPGVSPMDRLRVKTRDTIVKDLDIMQDAWMDTPEGTPIECIEIYASMRAHGLKAPSCAQVRVWLDKRLTDFTAALDETDKDLAEGYSYLSKAQLKERVKACTDMLKDLEQFRQSAKAARAPREKKLPTAMKQVERVQYMKQNNDFKITSINPIRVVGAYRLLAFNPKYRVLYDFVSDSGTGFLVRGTTLKNVDSQKTKYIRLRKPEDVLPIMLSGSAKLIEKTWGELTTKEGKPNHRINKEIVLLRVFEQPE